MEGDTPADLAGAVQGLLQHNTALQARYMDTKVWVLGLLAASEVSVQFSEDFEQGARDLLNHARALRAAGYGPAAVGGTDGVGGTAVGVDTATSHGGVSIIQGVQWGADMGSAGGRDGRGAVAHVGSVAAGVGAATVGGGEARPAPPDGPRPPAGTLFADGGVTVEEVIARTVAAVQAQAQRFAASATEAGRTARSPDASLLLGSGASSIAPHDTSATSSSSSNRGRDYGGGARSGSSARGAAGAASGQRRWVGTVRPRDPTPLPPPPVPKHAAAPVFFQCSEHSAVCDPGNMVSPLALA
jgi:hypothetical protein